jgi:hypothetical protein
VLPSLALSKKSVNLVGMTMNIKRRLAGNGWIVAGFFAAVAIIGQPDRAVAQNTVGGHFGVAFPLVTRADGKTTNLGDNFTTAFPMGITIKRQGSRMAFDLELVPAIQDSPRNVSLTVHPGLIWSLKGNWAAGIRAAFDVNQPSWGFTPLLARTFPITGHNFKLFAEVDVPIRFQKPSIGNNVTAVTLAIHIGTAF